jgi:hypothetical protein
MSGQAGLLRPALTLREKLPSKIGRALRKQWPASFVADRKLASGRLRKKAFMLSF